ncbi:MAG: hypothetical protein AAB634_03675 [Patescibacteria group bacterium]
MQKRNVKTIVIVIIVVIVLVVLFALPKYLDPNRELVSSWRKAGVACLTNGHTNLAKHFHPFLSVQIDGKLEAIPATVGVIPTCMAEIHMHDESGKIHVESFNGEKVFTLSQFFVVWGKTIEREGYDLKATLDGKPLENPEELILKDEQKIVLEYVASAPQPAPRSE